MAEKGHDLLHNLYISGYLAVLTDTSGTRYKLAKRKFFLQALTQEKQGENPASHRIQSDFPNSKFPFSNSSGFLFIGL